MMLFRNGSLVSLMVILALALTLVACGGDDDQVRTEADSSTSPLVPYTDTSAADSGTAVKPADTGAPQGAPMERPVVTADDQARIDAWLTAYADSLNDYGDPEGTMYAGGTPLFNEKKGEPVSKYEYIVAKHPDRPWEKPFTPSKGGAHKKAGEKKDSVQKQKANPDPDEEG
jgi:hypothetical protein